jgi:hypothetical protein
MLVYEDLTHKIIGTAIEVHKVLGPGLLESGCEECFCHELTLLSGLKTGLLINFKAAALKDGVVRRVL